VFVEVLRRLRDSGVEFCATIVGGPSESDIGYDAMIHEKISAYNLHDKVTRKGAVSHFEALALYREHELYVNVTPSGSMDKTIFEALVCGCKVVVSNVFFRRILPEIWVVADPTDVERVVAGIENALTAQNGYNTEKVAAFLEKHSLDKLTRELMKAARGGGEGLR